MIITRHSHCPEEDKKKKCFVEKSLLITLIVLNRKGGRATWEESGLPWKVFFTLCRKLMNLTVQGNNLQNRSTMAKALWLIEKKKRSLVIAERADNDNELPRTRSKNDQYDKTVCIIWQKTGSRTCKVSVKRLGKRCY